MPTLRDAIRSEDADQTINRWRQRQGQGHAAERAEHHADALKITSPSNHRRRSRWTEWRASDVKWKDDTRPPANIAPAIIFLVYVARDIALQDHRAEIVAEEAAHRELALLLIAFNWRVQIGGIVTDPSHLPLAEATAQRQINVDEVWIASIERECR